MLHDAREMENQKLEGITVTLWKPIDDFNHLASLVCLIFQACTQGQYFHIEKKTRKKRGRNVLQAARNES
jgi:hypothetical protein